MKVKDFLIITIFTMIPRSFKLLNKSYKKKFHTRRTVMTFEDNPPKPALPSRAWMEPMAKGSYVEWFGENTVQSFPGKGPHRTSPARVILNTGESAFNSASCISVDIKINIYATIGWFALTFNLKFVWICNGKPRSWAPIRLSSRGDINPIIPT
jgi:hypothetical protein